MSHWYGVLKTRATNLSFALSLYHFLVSIPRSKACPPQHYLGGMVTLNQRDSISFKAQWSGILTKRSSIKSFNTSRRPLRYTGFNLSIFQRLSALRQACLCMTIGKSVIPSSAPRALKKQDRIAPAMPMHAKYRVLFNVIVASFFFTLGHQAKPA